MNHVQTKALKNNWKQSVQSKSLMIAIAALALTASSAQAFSGDALLRAGLTETQLAAFEEARELRKDGDVKAARDILVEAGIDDDVIERVRTAMTENRQERVERRDNWVHKHQDRVKRITNELTESEQEAFAVARAANDRDAMQAILEEAGVTHRGTAHSPKFLKDGRELD